MKKITPNQVFQKPKKTARPASSKIADVSPLQRASISSLYKSDSEAESVEPLDKMRLAPYIINKALTWEERFWYM